MLDEFKEAEKAAARFSFQSMMESIREFVLPQWTVQVGFSLLLVGLGWVIGNRTSHSKVDATAYQQRIEMLATQVQDMKSTMMLSLLENPSATERLRAVGYTSEITHADDRVLEALFATLNNDPNVNVRLVTLEALTQYAGDASVREGLVKSLALQDSPMVQVALADVMVKMQEKRSVKALKTLLQKEDLNDLVKVKIEQTIKDLS
jgi:HEAT repeat protein